MTKFFFFCCFSFCFIQNLAAQQSNDSLNIDETIEKALNYLVKTQYSDNKNQHFKGEWHSTMGLIVAFPLLGYAKEYEDSNCFTVSAVHNYLAEIYLSDTARFHYLLPVIDSAFIAIQAFQQEGTYNFWHAYPFGKNKEATNAITTVRKPSTFKLNTLFIKKAANVKNDFDDTAAAFTASHLQSKIHPTHPKSPILAPLLRPYIDKNRRNYHWYNFFSGIRRNTQAYMTWIGEEYQHKKPNFLTLLVHNALFWHPQSAAHPHLGEAYIPYGANDVDAVVNANILAYLALNNELDSNATASDAIRFLEKQMLRKRPQKAVVYYPNDYHLAHAIARAYDKGVKKLEKTTKLLAKRLKNEQLDNGSFVSRKRINQGDTLQSTAYAIAALLDIGHFDQYDTRKTIEKGIHFLLSQQQIMSQHTIYWKSGVFFSGGTLVKNLLFFKSNAYTTALIANILLKYQLTFHNPPFKVN